MSTLQQDLQRRRTSEATASSVIAQDQPASLLVAQWKSDAWVLPWSQFVSARLNENNLELAFVGCVVAVTGRNLHLLLGDIASLRVESLRDLPPEYRRKVGETETFVEKIEVRPLAPSPSNREAPG